MKIIGCDFHPSYQQIMMLDKATGEMVEKALSHERKEEVRAFYAGLEGSVRVGIEASGQSQWWLLSIKLCLTDKSSGLLKTRLKHGIELRKNGESSACPRSPAAFFQ